MRWESNPLYNRELTRFRTEPWSGRDWVFWLALCIGLLVLSGFLWSWIAALVLGLLSIPQFIWKYRRDQALSNR